MDEVPRAFAISDIQSSPAGDERSTYASCVRSTMTYGSETMPLLVDVGLKFQRTYMQMTRWMCGVSMKDRRTSEELRRLVGVEPITTVIRSGSLGWDGHVMMKGVDDCVMKCMEFRVEGRRQKASWKTKKDMVESVEADMAKLQIDKEYAHDINKWRRNVTKRKSNPIGKGTINH